MRRLLALAAAIAAVASACTASDDAGPSRTVEPLDAVSTTTSDSTTTTQTTTTKPPAAVRPSVEGPIAVAVELALRWFNGEPLDELSYSQLFGTEARQQLSYEALAVTLQQLARSSPWTLVEEVSASPDSFVGVVVDGAGERFQLSLVLDTPSQVVINTMLIQPAFEQPVSVEEATQRLVSLGSLRYLTAETTDGQCDDDIEADGADEMMPLGSVFKLYVLAAIVEEISTGRLAWDTDVEIRDELDSLPTGVTQDDPAGSSRSVRELAERMISISDNTATDHLIDLVGREKVEAAVTNTGHAEPSLNAPFLTTRELFVIKFGGDGQLLVDYLAADEAARRVILDEDVAERELPPVSAVGTDPLAVDSLEWFASPRDLCRLLVGLAVDEAARAVMSINPGVPAQDGRWDYIGFKGGSEPGVVAAVWLLEDGSGQQFVFAGGLANGAVAFNPNDAVRNLAVLRDDYARS